LNNKNKIMSEFLEMVFSSKEIKPKRKTEMISNAILSKELSIDELLSYAVKSSDSNKATCIEAIEFVTQKDKKIVDKKSFDIVISQLTSKAPRVIWESSKLIGNICSNFPDKIEDAVKALLKNTTHPGTVVRWSTAYALCEIAKLKTSINKELVPALKNIAEKEENNGAKKVYIKGLKGL